MRCWLHLTILCTSLFSIKAVHVLIDTYKSKCPGYDEGTRFMVTDPQFLVVNRTTYISNTVNITEDIQSDLKFEIFPTRCKSKDALDTCETYRSYKLKNVCAFMKVENVPWSPFVNNYHPPVTCPPRKGVHLLINGTLNAVALPQWTKSYWKVLTVIREQANDNFVFCAYLEFKLI